MSWRVEHGECVEVMAAMPEASVDAIVCDPPYGLEFMGKDWDSFKRGRAAAYSSGGSLHDPEARRGKGGAGPNYTARPAKRCAKCGKQAWSGSPCECPEPEWTIDNSTLHAFQAWCEAWAREALRILKPGGHLLAFGGTRTYHRLASGIEDAGFEIRDSCLDCVGDPQPDHDELLGVPGLAWLFGSGFPKSLDVSKAIDRAAGAEREVVGVKPSNRPNVVGRVPGGSMGGGAITERLETAPATPDAKRWEGWGTALKPAFEPVVVARKPLAGTVAANVLAHGTGAINVAGCRIDGQPRTTHANGHRSTGSGDGWGMGAYEATVPAGRWPANVVLDREAAAALDEQTGELTSNSGEPFTRNAAKFRTAYGDFKGADAERGFYGDSGGASRFFYVAKADTAERNAGLGDVVSLWAPTDTPDRNDHPTVKPIDLMRWLVRLVTPPGGTVLDPFTGSGTTGCAAVLEDRHFVGIEREAAYVSIARARIAHWSTGTAEAAA